MSDKKKKRDLLLIAVILAIACILFVVFRIIYSEPPVQVEISVDGTLISTLNLNQDMELDIEGFNGGTNHLVIQDGQATMTDATCPDKVCVRTGQIHNTGQSIVCLPNRVIVMVIGSSPE